VFLNYSNKKESDSGEIDISDSIAHGGDHERRKIEEPIGLKGLKIFWILGLVFIFVIFFRTAQLQISKGAYYLSQAENNRIGKIVIKAPRGIITDSRGEELVENIASFNAILAPGLFGGEKEERLLKIRECLSFAGIKENDWEGEIENWGSLDFYLVKEDIGRDEALLIELEKEKCPGLVTEKTAKRNYRFPFLFAHTLGYTGKVTKEDLANNSGYLMIDSIGKNGTEETWEKELKGTHGFTSVEVDSQGRILRKLEEKPPVFGNRLVLGLDKNLQSALQSALEGAFLKTEAKRAAAVVIDPRDGLVRALISLPSYDNNLFGKKVNANDYQKLIEDPNRPLINRVIAGKYPPGSTIKPLLGLAALEEEIINQQTSFDCHGIISVGGFSFRDWKTHGPGIDLKKAIAESCDVFFYLIGGGGGESGFTGLGIDKIGEYEKKWGLDNLTNIDLEGEVKGLVPSSEWKLEQKKERWYIGDTYHLSIGQGDGVFTPIALANYVSAVANGGTLYRPRLVKEVLEEGTKRVIKENQPEILSSNLASPENLRIIREAMRETIVSGTARSLSTLPKPVCGKTGTAQVGGTEKTHSWFVGFGPEENPEVAIAVIVEEGGESTDSAVPVAKAFFEEYFKDNP
jgi:penicillin-binding protein 2